MSPGATRLIQAVTLDDVKRVAKRLFDPARLTVVVAGTPVEGSGAGRPQAPVRPAPPPRQAAAPPAASRPPVAPASPGVKPAPKPAVKPPVRRPRRKPP